MDKEKGRQGTIDENSAGDGRNGPSHGPSGKDHRSSDVSSDHANGPSGEDHRSGDAKSHDGDAPTDNDLGGTSGATERANILSSDELGLTVKLFERGTPVTTSISHDVMVRAVNEGLSLKVGEIVRIPVFKEADKVDTIFRDM